MEKENRRRCGSEAIKLRHLHVTMVCLECVFSVFRTSGSFCRSTVAVSLDMRFIVIASLPANARTNFNLRAGQSACIRFMCCYKLYEEQPNMRPGHLGLLYPTSCPDARKHT